MTNTGYHYLESEVCLHIQLAVARSIWLAVNLKDMPKWECVSPSSPLSDMVAPHGQGLLLNCYSVTLCRLRNNKTVIGSQGVWCLEKPKFFRYKFSQCTVELQISRSIRTGFCANNQMSRKQWKKTNSCKKRKIVYKTSKKLFIKSNTISNFNVLTLKLLG